MITDKQGREWLLKKLYDDGWRYYAKDISGCVFLTKKEPVMIDNILGVMSGGFTKSADAIAEIMPNIDGCGILDIAKELGIVDWYKVKVDTPILVSCDGKNWYNRYFASFDGVNIMAWECGATSWSVDYDVNEVYRWKYAKLAKV